MKKNEDQHSAIATSTKWIKGRLLFTIVLFVGLFAGVSWRAYSLQIKQGPRLRELAQQQYLKRTELSSRRGAILDRLGTPLAVSVDVDSIYANPRMIGSKSIEVAHALATILNIDQKKLEKRLSSRRYFTWVKRRVSVSLAKKVKALKIRGVFLQKESKRFYPNRGLGATVVGFAGLDSKGLEGIEKSLDSWLKGPRKRVEGLRDALGRRLYTEKESKIERTSHDVVLTIDRAIQHETESALKHIIDEHKPNWAAAVVLDAKNGDVLAMASAPTYDPNHFSKFKPKHWRNRTITDAFEPGSTIKMFSVTAALASNKTTIDEIIPAENGRMRIGKHFIHDSKPYKELDIRNVLKKSSNICVSKLAIRMGNNLLYRYLRSFGFAEKTNIPLVGERRGTLRNPKRWSKVGLANISFGQGMTSTVLQLAQAMTAISNDGMLMQPRLVREIRNANGKAIKSYEPQGRQIITKRLARRMRHLLNGVTEEGGTAELASLDRYTVAGKTGTAQKIDPTTGTYSKEITLSSFVATAPSSDPRIVVAIVVDEPSQEAHYGGEVAGPAFRQIANHALRYLGVKPDKIATETHKKEIRNKSEQKIKSSSNDESLAPLLPGVRPNGHILIPDFTGLSIRQALSVAHKARLKLDITGSGRAVAQSPGPGPANTDRCKISFRQPQ